MLGAIFAHIFREFVKAFRDFFAALHKGFRLRPRLLYQFHNMREPSKVGYAVTPPRPWTTSGSLSCGFGQKGLLHQSFVGHSGYICPTNVVLFSQLGHVVQHSWSCEFHSCALCREVSHQGRHEGAPCPGCRSLGGAKNRKSFLQSSTFTSKIP